MTTQQQQPKCNAPPASTAKTQSTTPNQPATSAGSSPTYELRDLVNRSAESLPYSVDEFEHCGIEKAWSEILPIKIPMVAASPVRFECQYFTTLRLPGNPPFGTADVVIGRVLGVHIADSCITNGKIDVTKTQPIARCGYYDYAVVDKTFEMIIPGEKAQLGGLEGSTKWNRGFTRMQSQDADIPKVQAKEELRDEEEVGKPQV